MFRFSTRNGVLIIVVKNYVKTDIVFCLFPCFCLIFLDLFNTCQTFYAEPKKKKNFCFWKCGWREKSSPGWLQFYFFNWFSGDTVFPFSVSFAFYVFLFFSFFLYFLKLKICILIHIWLCEWVSDKKFSPGRFPETRLLFWSIVAPVMRFAFH